jgi:hypothetical protein
MGGVAAMSEACARRRDADKMKSATTTRELNLRKSFMSRSHLQVE